MSEGIEDGVGIHVISFPTFTILSLLSLRTLFLLSISCPISHR